MSRVAVEPGAQSRRLLVLGAGPAQLGLLEAARHHRIWTAVCDRDPSAPGFAFADRRCIVSTDDEPAIERLAAALELDGIVSAGSDRTVAVSARIAEKLGLPAPVSAATAILATNRLKQREALAAAAVPQPRWRIAAEGDDELGLSLPLVLKAPDRTDRVGVTVVRSMSELADAFAAVRHASRTSAVLVEEIVEGPEVTVSAFSAAGEFVPLAVTDRLSSETRPFGVPLAHVWPSVYAEAAAEVSRRAVEALGITDGPSYTLLRISRGGPEVIEVAARLGGGHDAELVGLVTGVDLNGLALAAALGEPLAASELPDAPRISVGGAATRFLVAPAGVLESVEVPQGLKGVVAVRIYREPGYAFQAGERASEYAGALLAAGATRDEAVTRAEAAAERIRFLTVDAEALV